MTTADRRATLIEAETINGIDFVELDPGSASALRVYFIFNLFNPPAPDQTSPTLPLNPTDAMPLTESNFTITGGERITSITVTAVTQPTDTYNQLGLTLSEVGDFSTYTLTLGNPPGDLPGVPPGFDPQSASADFIFHVDCAKDFDCEPTSSCPPKLVPPPPINYLAKDYPGFVTTMLDRMSLLAPTWSERNPADLGVAVVETLAYVADHLTYRQDVIATEAYLGTARLRTSARRHARLVDYPIGEGNNARAWIGVTVGSDGVLLPAGTVCATAFGGATPPILEHSTLSYEQAINAGAVFFETMVDSPALHPANAEMPLYNWSNSLYCLPVGATSATLAGSYPALAPGMVVVIAEILGPDTGDPADADPTHRQAVALTAVTPTSDPLDAAPLTEIEWHAEDALTFPVCVASVTDAAHGGKPIIQVSAAWGNIVLADQGRSVGTADPVLGAPEPIGDVPETGAVRPSLASSPLTFAAPPPQPTDPATAAAPGASAAWVASVEVTSSDSPGQPWTAVEDLLATGIGATTRVFVPEVETDGTAYLRFGDGVNGEPPKPGASLSASYRVGNGTAGNVARNSITLVDTTTAGILGVSNPLPAWGGVDPETVDHVRQSAPVAFQTTQQRAVTPADYVAVTTSYPGVQRAAATMRFTGSWTTVFITVERDAQAALDANFIAGLEATLDGYRMAGVDLEVEDGVQVPLHVVMQVCVQCGYVAVDVEQALLAVFSNGVLPDGTLGIFNPKRLDLGAPFYLSPLYAAAQAIDGVASVEITTFERQDAPSDAGLQSGVLTPQPLEFFVLANDPNNPELGLFELTVAGGL